MTQKLPISALMIAYNEASNLPELADNLNRASEWVIMDSFSQDGTAAWAAQQPQWLRFYQQKFVDFTTQRNDTLDKAQCDWVLFVDGDERIPEALWQEIEQVVQMPDNPIVAYYFYRKFMFMGKPIHFSATQSDKNYRLFRKSKARYVQERLVHETLQVDGPVGKLRTKMIHYSYNDYTTYHNKMVHYGRLKAKELFQNKGTRPQILRLIVKPLYKFLYSYLVRLGILDGWPGVVLCYLQAKSVWVTQKELFRLART